MRRSFSLLLATVFVTACDPQPTTGSLVVNLSGLPSGALGAVRISGPNEFYQVVRATTTIENLPAGRYAVIRDTVVVAANRYGVAQARDSVTVERGRSASTAAVYMIASGSIALSVAGLPETIVSNVRVRGPAPNYPYNQVHTAPANITGLVPGQYVVITDSVIGACPNLYITPNRSQNFTVSVAETTNATVSYTSAASSPGNLNLQIEKLYLMQATQNHQGTVPIIAGKPALLRVFGVANQCNTLRPRVRVTTSTGFVQTIDAPEDSVRLGQDESRELTSWNVVIPAENVQTGMTVFAEMDVTGVVAESNENDNRFPAAGGKPIDVRTVPPIGVRLVPIVQNGTTGNANALIGMEWPRKIHPVSTYDVDVRAAPLTSSGTLRSCTGPGTGATTDADGSSRCLSWENMLGEVEAMRMQDIAAGVPGGNRYYYGVARVSYSGTTGGVAGIAYVPGKSGMGWDASSGSRVMAHEMGHNFLRLHAPCGNPGGPDPSYPYVGGVIGVHGWDPVEGFKTAAGLTDVMGYCGNQWISDYTYVAMLNWLTDPNRTPTLPYVSGAQQPSFLVWGRMGADGITLEPAFEVSASPAPIQPGPHRLAFLDETGAEVYGVSFEGNRIADLPGDPESFAFHVPLSALRGRSVSSLRLTARGRTVTNVPSTDVSDDPNAVVTRVNAQAARIRWDATRFPVVMVRDPDSGMVLSFARGGDATIATPKAALDLNFSNRVSSSRRYREFK